jgi:hypothetical protein
MSVVRFPPHEGHAIEEEGAPRGPLTPTQRIRTAYAVVEREELALRMGNDPTSGYKLLARAALVNIGVDLGWAKTKDWFAALTAECSEDSETR